MREVVFCQFFCKIDAEFVINLLKSITKRHNAAAVEMGCNE